MGSNGYCREEKKTKGIERFIEAQSKEYKIAHEEISEGKKRSHWIWYIYPQITGLGMSYMDREYSIKSIKETIEYINNELLFKRLYEMTKLLLKIEHNDIKEVMWYPDDLKLRSCMTLFFAVSGEKIFEKVIDKFYEGEKDLKTIEILNKMHNSEKQKLDKKFCNDIEKRIDKIENEEKLKLEKKIKLEKEKKLKLEKEKEKEMKLKKEKENELKKLKEKDEINKNKNSGIKEDKKEVSKDKDKQIKEVDKKEIKKEQIPKNSEQLNKNNELKNKTNNKELRKEEPMDLDEQSIQNKNNIKKDEKEQKDINVKNDPRLNVQKEGKTGK